MRTPTVIGVGNLLLRDEGVGVRAAELLRERVPQGVRVVEAGGVGAELLPEVEDALRLLVLDCIDLGGAPGTIMRLGGGDVATEGGAHVSPHQFGLADLLVLSALRGTQPEEVVVLGVQPAAIEPGLDLSPEVGAALPRLVERAVEILERWVAPGPAGPTG